MQSLAKDLRYSLRRLAKARWFSITVILMLAFGVGACATMFSLIEGILLRPLPFHDPSRLVQLGEHVGNNPGIGATARDIGAYAAQSSAFSSMGGFTGETFELAGREVPEVVSGARLTGSVFPTLGVQPNLGRVFTRQEDDARAQVAVIGYSLWTDRFHRDPRVAGSSIELNRKAYTIIGVMPRNFEFPLQVGRLNQAQLWVPMSFTPEELSDEAAGMWGFQIVARLKDGISVPQAAQDANRVAGEIMRDFPPNMSNIRIRGDVQLLSEVLTGDVKPLLRILFAAVLVVLLIACANVTILMLVRAVRSHRDHALRLALGARSGTVLRETLLEGSVLSLAGAILGLVFAAGALRMALSLWPDSMPRIGAISVDAVVALFAVAVALLTGAACSLAPAFVALRTNPMLTLKQTGGGASGHLRIRSTLAVAEIAIALLLLTVSGAFLRSYRNMLAVDPGFRPEHVLVAGYQLPATQYPSDATIETFNRTVIDRLSTTSAVLSAGIGSTLPSSGNSGLAAYTVGGERLEGWKLRFAAFDAIDGDYFQALGIPLLSGRTFTAADRSDSPLVVIVSQSMAQHSWPGQNPIGKRMHVGNPKKGLPWATVVGVVGNTRIGARDQRGNDQWYVPAEQPAILNGTQSTQPRTVPAGGFIVLRAALPPQQMIGLLQHTVAGIDPLLALDQVQPMSDVLARTETPRRFMTELIAAFGFAAIALAFTGIYAVMSFAVSLRRQEIAIRMAVGAQRDSIARLVLRSGARLALFGCMIGIVASVAASRFVQSFLFGVTATNPWVYIAGVAVMMLIAVLASVLPATRAAAADPIATLRSLE
ncbi:MAG TPA: ABC transporter permease [Terracidiphilus sp.]|jgi:putative ABC transport system permease protein|nr:ABC transporter permease [Terracidiphilus sp.]